jgi:photosystem II stability/assembly factor-like uncharacterized protein
VVFAGTGKFSNSGDGGSNIGILKSVDGGATWSLVGANEMAGLPLTAITPVSATAVLAAALDKAVIRRSASGGTSFNRDGTIVTDVRRDGGVLRSTNGGATWSNISELGVSGLPQGPVSDLVADPGNANTFFAAVVGQGVYRTTDGGANWAVISENLVASNLQTLDVVRTESGVKVLLVGSEQGVFRTLDPVPGADWTEFGRGLPNALARDLQFADRSSADDVLLAGLLGRGVFTVAGDADAILDDQSVLHIDGTSAEDTISLVRSPANASLLDVYVNSTSPIFSVPLSSVERIEINGLGGIDTLIVDSTQGAIHVPGGLIINGGDDSDTLRLDGDRYTDRTETTDGPNTTITIRRPKNSPGPGTSTRPSR